MKKLVIALVFASTHVCAQNITVVSQPANFQLTCFNPTVNLSVVNNLGTSLTFTCIGPFGPVSGTTVGTMAAGIYTIQVNANQTITTIPVHIYSNIIYPLSSLSSTIQNITQNQNPQIVTAIALSPTTNITHKVYAPFGGVQTTTSATLSYLPTGPGTYTHCITNDINGCSTCKQFIVNMLYTGLNKQQYSAPGLNIFPNPANDFIGITGFETVTVAGKIEIVNSLGQCVLALETDAGNLPMRINTTTLCNGIYALRFSDPSKHLHDARFVIAR